MAEGRIVTDKEEEFTVERRLLEKTLVHHSWRVGPNVRESMRYTTDFDIDRNESIERIEAYVLSEHLADDVYQQTFHYDVPKSTWQMFKQSHAASWWLGWLVSLWPVKQETRSFETAVKVERYVNYPESHIKIPGLGHPFIDERVHRLESWEIRQRNEQLALDEAKKDERQVEVYLLVEDTIEDLVAATGLSAEWFQDALGFDREFELHSKIYVIPQEVHDV